MTLRSLLLVAILFAAGCQPEASSERYKVITSATGELFRLDASSGALYKLNGAALIRVTETDRIQLQVNAIYLFENGSYMKYLGKGRFEPATEILTLEEYLKQHGKK